MSDAVLSTDIPGVSIIIPAYNEKNGISPVIEQISEVCSRGSFPFEIIVVDDGSTDGTSDILQEKKVKVIRHPENRGYGASIKTGVLSSKYPWILITDADGTYPIEDIPKLVETMADYDMVVGSRIGDNVNIPLIRRPAKWLLNQLANFMAQRKIPDLNSGFRIFSKECFMRFINIYPSGFSLTTTITLALLSNHYNVKYLPVNYYKREGKSKIRPIRDTYNFFVLVIRTIMYFDPLRVFMPISIVLFHIGVIFSLFELYVFHNITTAAAIVLFAALQTFVLGLLADLIVKGHR